MVNHLGFFIFLSDYQIIRRELQVPTHGTGAENGSGTAIKS